jgi:glycosyltransferase involved in cell wall biosynthesis
MAAPVSISICIPAYKRAVFLKRLLDSIAIQSFRDFEVILTDDSPDMEVQDLSRLYQERFPLAYRRNEPALGTPENWNEAIRRAKGDWIKLMHDDDWFADAESLGHFATAVVADPKATFFFSAYRNIHLDEDRAEEVFIDRPWYRRLLKNPATLFSRNMIGPPSVVLHRRDNALGYDKTIKWVVDIDFYIRSLAESKPVYIDRVLVNVGIGDEQVTRDCFRRRPIEIPENFHLLNKTGLANLKNIWVYDAWWRLMRNLEIRRVEDIRGSGYTGTIPGIILSMIRWQRRVPLSFLKIGPFSKTLMFVSYLVHYPKIES